MIVKIEMGYTLNYETKNGDVGGFANIHKPEGLEVTIDEIGGEYHCHFKLDEIYIQAWFKSYEIKLI